MFSSAKRMLLVPALALLAAAAAPAVADTTAVYGSDLTSSSMKIEIDDNGDLRGEVAGQPHHFIRRGGELFLIEKTSSGHRVIKFDDLRQLIAERVKEAAPKPGGSLAAADRANTSLVQKGGATVNGRRGKAWFDRTREGELYPQPVLVISDDPALAELGQAMAAHYAISAALIGNMLNVPASKTDTQRILESGASLQFANLRLQTISSAPIDPERFILPAAPLEREQVRKWLIQELR